MVLLGIQIVAVLFALLMIYLAHIYYKKHDFGLNDFLLWGAAWAFFIIVTVFPRSVDFVVQTLTLSDTMQFLIIAGLTFLAALVFYMYRVVRKMQHQVERLVIELARRKRG